MPKPRAGTAIQAVSLLSGTVGVGCAELGRRIHPQSEQGRSGLVYCSSFEGRAGMSRHTVLGADVGDEPIDATEPVIKIQKIGQAIAGSFTTGLLAMPAVVGDQPWGDGLIPVVERGQVRRFPSVATA
ncbi:hypothetical protein [Streptomyces sp. 6N106]|uniref:hypothetical protein n=1 Tax=Streptomyces sp. 6N106 TaxID=3457418 RepID=UPI003FD60D0A